MTEEKTIAEFEIFAGCKGRKIEDGGNVSFDDNEAAARAFDAEAHKAGFGTVVEFVPTGSYRDFDDLSKLPNKNWFVRLE